MRRAREKDTVLEVDVGAIIWLIDHAQSDGLDIFSRDLHRAGSENAEKPQHERSGVRDCVQR